MIKPRWGIILVVGFWVPNRGQTAPHRGVGGPAVVRWETGVRGAGMAGSYVAAVDDPSGVYWNPAALQQVERREVQFQHAAGFAEENQEFIGYVHPLWRAGERETWALGLTLLGTDRFTLMREGQSQGSARLMDEVVGLSYAHPLGPVAWGATGKYIRSETDVQTGDSYAVDMGLHGKFDRWGWGLTLNNLGPPLRLGETNIPLPTLFRAGVCWTHPRAGPGTVLLTAQADWLRGDERAVRGGAEYEVPVARDWRAAIRAGARNTRSGKFSVGAGLEGTSLSVRYAFTPGGDLGNTNRMEFSFRFGGKLEEETRRSAGIEKARDLLDRGHLLEANAVLNELTALSPRHRPVRLLSRDLHERLGQSLDAEWLMDQGQAAFAQKEYDRACRLFQKLLVVYPSHADARAWLDKATSEDQKEKLAAIQAEVLRARQQETDRALLQARRLMSRGEWVEALEAWGQYVAQGGEPRGIRSEREQCLSKVYALAEEKSSAGDLPGACRLFQLVEKNGPFREADQRAADLAGKIQRQVKEEARRKYEEGVKAFGRGDVNGARRLFEDVLHLAPDDKGARQALDRLREESSFPPKSP